MSQPLWRRLLAEYVGTATLLAAIVGSGVMASSLSPGDVGLQLLENVLAIVLALGVLILVFTPVSGAHFNPVISLADWVLRRRSGCGPSAGTVAGYCGSQILGGATGTVLANVMFDLPAVTWSGQDRTGGGLWTGEVVATAGLVLLVFAMTRTGRAAAAPVAVAAYIAAAAWFTSSTAFANPAVTIARTGSDTFTGISPGSVPGFLCAQALGLGIGLLLVVAFHPAPAEAQPTPGTAGAPSG